jgi:RNA polymerase sigma-70 factor (ECF subfamily)
MPDWQEILDRDGRAAWQTAYRLLGNQADADDCFQEACLAAVQVSGRESVRDWRALLQRLATLRAMDQLRGKNRASRRLFLAHDDQVPDIGPSPIQTAQEAELADQLRLALSRIPPRQAEAFCLHCIEDWSYEEIARHGRLSVTAVGVLLNRARERLRVLLAGFGEKTASRVRTIDRKGNQQATIKAREEHS